MNNSSLLSKLDKFPKIPVLVVGDLMVDRFIRGRVSRLSPEAPVPVVDVQEDQFMPGGAGNVAANIAALGGRAILVSVVGRDADGDRLLESLKVRGVDVRGVVRDASRPTILKTRVIAGHQQVVRFDKESRDSLQGEVLSRYLQEVKSRLSESKGVIVSDYGKGAVSPALLGLLMPLANRQRKIITVDPKVEHFLRYKGVHCITPNLKEAAEGLRSLPPKDDKDVDELGRRILQRLRCRTVLITRGERGMSLYQSGAGPVHIPSRAKEVFDVTGAGDTVIAAFSLALAAGCGYVDAARLSNVAAGIVVAKLGTATVTQDEMKKVMSNES